MRTIGTILPEKRGFPLGILRAVAVVAVFITTASCACPPPPESSTYLSGKRLSKRLIVTDSRSGIGGERIREWRINRSGRYRYRTWVAGARRKRSWRGRLTQQQLARIAGCLDQNRFAELPEEQGLPGGPNLWRITIQFGSDRRHLRLNRDQSLDKLGSGQGGEARFARIASGIFAALTKE